MPPCPCVVSAHEHFGHFGQCCIHWSKSSSDWVAHKTHIPSRYCGWPNESECTGAHAQVLAGLPSLATAAARLPPVHVDEDDQRFTITADVPGLSKDDIKVRRARTLTSTFLSGPNITN